jgi:hypothetical protein
MDAVSSLRQHINGIMMIENGNYGCETRFKRKLLTPYDSQCQMVNHSLVHEPAKHVFNAISIANPVARHFWHLGLLKQTVNIIGYCITNSKSVVSCWMRLAQRIVSQETPHVVAYDHVARLINCYICLNILVCST